MPRWVRAVVITGCFIGIGWMGVDALIARWMASRNDFRKVAEATLEVLLGNPVSVRRCTVKRLSRIDLSGFSIRKQEKSQLAYDFQVPRVTFKYNWWKLLLSHSLRPHKLILESPKIHFKAVSAAYDYLSVFADSPGLIPSTVEWGDGEVIFSLPGLSNLICLKKIQGTIESKNGTGIVKVVLNAVLMGELSGPIRIEGQVDLVRRSHQLVLFLDNLRVSPKLPVRLDELHGKILWEDDDITLEKFTVRLYGWKALVQCQIKNFFAERWVDFKLSFDRKEKAGLKLGVRLIGNRFEAEMKDKSHPLMLMNGEVSLLEHRVQIRDLRCLPDLRGDASIDLGRGAVSARLENPLKNQRYQIQTELRGLETRFNIGLDHVNFSGMDLATQMELNLHPVTRFKEARLWKFMADFQTHYFVLNKMVFDDFQGRFDLGPSGAERVDVSWGESFQLTGLANYRNGKLESDFLVAIHQFDLQEIEDMAGRPMPKKMGGIADGEIRLKGWFPKPAVTGYLSIKDGCFGHLAYDKAVMPLAGVPPMINLKDAYVYKGRTKLALMGSVNLALPNILHDIKYQQPDNMLVWKGFEMESNSEDVEIKKEGAEKFSLSLKAETSTGDNYPENKPKDENEDKFVGVGPKIRF